jgi:Galactose-3-O-sulfotransferase.
MRRVLRSQYRSSEVMELRPPTVAPGRLRRDGSVAYFAGLPEPARLKTRLIMGHLTFGLHEFVPRPSTYVTLLREPLSLVRSQYQHVRRHEGHLLHEEAKRFPDLTSYVQSGISLEMDNSQTRAFAGDNTTAFGACTPQMLDRAKENLDGSFAVMGLTERFDESLVLMQRAFGWERVRYVSVNIDPNRAKRDPLSNDELELLRRHNALDLELYGWATERFERTLAAWSGFGDALGRFRRDNDRYQRWGRLSQAPRAALERVSGR